MVVPLRQARSSSSFKKHILQVAIAVCLMVASYTASRSETPSDDSHHWKPPFLDWLLGSQDDDPGTTLKKDIVVPDSSRYQTNKNHTNASSGGVAAADEVPYVVNVPTLRSKLKLKARGATQHSGYHGGCGSTLFSSSLAGGPVTLYGRSGIQLASSTSFRRPSICCAI
jgi:hypothetical protein